MPSSKAEPVFNQAHLNRLSSALILEKLVNFGVTDICVAPGSRSTPLILEADLHPALTLHHHFDERGLGFYALGVCKATKQSVAIIVTSGTAVANLLPAVVEANLTGEKLILLTADRPAELIGCGANQAIQQMGIFSQHVTAALNLNSPAAVSTDELVQDCIETIHNVGAVLQLQWRQQGPVHINCPFAEPLYCEEPFLLKNYLPGYQDVKSWVSANTSALKPEAVFDDHLSIDLVSKPGIVVVGSVELSVAQAAIELAQKLGWPLFCDPQSGVSSAWSHYDVWLDSKPAKKLIDKAEVVIQFGPRIVSKRLMMAISTIALKEGSDYLFIYHDWRKSNPSHVYQTHINTDPIQWVRHNLDLIECLGKPHYYGWGDTLTQLQLSTAQALTQLTSCQPQLSEVQLAANLHRISRGFDLFLGNSLFVRLVDMFGQLNGSEVYSNRGASGIDGLLATTAGIQAKTERPLLAVIGDTSLLYDLNSLALFRQSVKTSVIITVNNDGGAIFDMLPIDQSKKQSLYQRPHGMQFQSIANQFGLTYRAPNSWDELVSAIEMHQCSGTGTLFVEVITAAGESTQDIKTIKSQLTEQYAKQ
jgi:2-succinyl-5-enolpyruvyl-6-hydroxy-3-cyclohexene-1-carboxylate synthase